jgi:UDP-N-acetylmuramoyl-tripeptide--D-alanyl-D-alanine ligase
MTTLREIALVLKAHVPFEFQDGVVTELAIDSRKIVVPSQALFFAIAGERHDGHRFIAEVYAKGVRAFVVNSTYAANQFSDAVFFSVDDTLIALQQVAATKRNASNIPVVGITGSNGKTIVKEWLYQLLSHDVNIVRSPKSYNSQVGVPLSVWKLEPEHQLALFEAGISEPGEMIRLERIIRPTIGIFTNLGHAHDENFTSLKQKAHEKLDLFQHCETVIYCKDYLIIEEELAHYVFVKRPRMFTWSRKSSADLQIGRIEKREGQTSIQAIFQHRFIRISIPFTDEASIENAIHCGAFLLLSGMDDARIAERMLLLTPVAMRLELKQGLNNCSVINDTYNSDLQSISIALDFLEQQHQHPKRTLILSDILQTGRTDNELYAEVAAVASAKTSTPHYWYRASHFRAGWTFSIGCKLFPQYGCISERASEPRFSG